jgi:hypothetical protein
MSDKKVPDKESSTGAEGLLDEAAAELKRGHFAAARKLLDASQRASGGDEKSVAEKRAALWARLAPDPLVAWLVAACLVLYVSLIAVFVN